jgi:type I restriction enzyme S subunit
MSVAGWTQLRHAVTCLDGRRVPVSAEERSDRQGPYPYWGANGVVDTIDGYLFDEPLVLLGEDGAPFFDPAKQVAFCISGPIWVNNHIHVLRTGSRFDPRFVTHCLNVTDYGPWIGGTTRDKLTQDDMSCIPIPDLPLSRQRVIADYLDAETARIDSVLIARARVLSLVAERPWRLFERLVVESGAARLPMRRALIDIADGPFGSAFASDDYVDEGAFVVRLGNIGFAEFVPEPAAFIPLPLYRRFPRCHVRPGDLLVAGLGDDNNHAGRACVAPELGPTMVKGKCFCAVTDPSRAEVAFLALYLSSSLGAAEVDAASHGSTRAMINLDIIKSTLVPLPSLVRQREILDCVSQERLRAEITSTKLSRQIELLLERRQALITAAVTGQIEIPGVAA